MQVNRTANDSAQQPEKKQFYWCCAAVTRPTANISRDSFVLYRSRGRNVLHMAIYAAAETVELILGTPAVKAALLNQCDHQSEDQQWGVYYFSYDRDDVRDMFAILPCSTDSMSSECDLDEPIMAEKICSKWAVVKLDRNRMACRWVMAAERQDLDDLATVKFEGVGDEMDEKSVIELHKAKAACRSSKPDRSPLHCAAEEQNLMLAEGLLRKGASVDQKDCFGMTPLHTAAKNGDERLVRLLCNRRADLSTLDNTGSTALQVAQDNGHHHLEQLLNPRLH